MGEKHDKNLEQMARSGKACGYFWKGAGKETLNKGLSDVLRGCQFISFEENGDSKKNGKAEVSAKGRDKKLIAREFRLTRREFQVLGLIAQALSNKEIAHRLFISDQTVSVHRKNIMRKLGVSNTAGLIKWAFENDLA
jgi:DNA-binding NarL/FixJ family response regulator